MRGLEGSRVGGFAALCGTLLAALTIGGCGSSSSATPPRPVAAADAVAALAPLVWLHSDEEWFPMDAERFIDRSTVKLRGERCLHLVNLAAGSVAKRKTLEDIPITDPGRLGKPPGYRGRLVNAECRPTGPAYSTAQHTRPFDDGRVAGLEGEEGVYLDLLSESYDGDPTFERDGSGRTMTNVPLYFEREATTVGGRPGLALTYWMLFGVSRDYRDGDPRPNKHEGDWERVVVLARETKAGGRYVPFAMRFYEDEQRWEVPWSELDVVDATHPVVYSAALSHTPYHDAGSHERSERSGGKSFVVDEETEGDCGDCVGIRSWRLLRAVSHQPWYGYGGGWGLAFKTDGTSGPLGPSPFER